MSYEMRIKLKPTLPPLGSMANVCLDIPIISAAKVLEKFIGGMIGKWAKCVCMSEFELWESYKNKDHQSKVKILGRF